MNILIIDDELDILDLLESCILNISEDYCVLKTQTFHQAQEYISQNKIDFILCDFYIDKFEATIFISWLNQNSFIIPLCLMSGFMPEVNSLEYPVQIHTLHKPFDSIMLKLIIEQYK